MKANKLKPGMKVNGHERGLFTVVIVKKHGYDGTKVIYNTMDGEIEIIYYPRFNEVEAI